MKMKEICLCLFAVSDALLGFLIRMPKPSRVGTDCFSCLSLFLCAKSMMMTWNQRWKREPGKVRTGHAFPLLTGFRAHTHTHSHTHTNNTLTHTHKQDTHTHTHKQHTHTHTNTHTFCVAGVAQPHIHRRFAWQAWHSWHWVARLDWLGRPWRRGTLRGRRATTWHPPSFHVAGVAQTHIHRRFAWQAWHSWHWVARLDWLGRPWRRGTLRGRRATTWHPPSFHVAGVAQPHIHLRFTWQAWHSWHWVACLDWLGRPWRRGTLRGRRATTWHPPSFHVAGVAQPHIHLRFTWQAWHSWHWVACLDWLGRLWRRGTLCGTRGTHSHLLSFHVAGVAQPHIHLRFTWQAWHKLTSTVVLRGRRGTHGTGWRAWTGLGARDAAALCVAGVPQPDIHLRFTWQAWHNLTSTFVSRGRRGTNSHPPSFCVAGVALMALGGALGLAWAPVTPRHFAWQACHNLTSTFVSRGRRGTNSHPQSFCVALMALGGALGLAWAPVTPRHFAWQAWHKLTPTVVSRGRRGTTSHPPSFHVAGVALMALGGALGLAWAPVTPRHFAWQACHNLTSTFVSRGRRGTTSHPPSFHVAGVALMALGGVLGLAWAPVTPRHFAWQAWHKLTPTVVSRGRRGTNSHRLSFCVAGVAQTHIHRRLAWQPWYRWHWVARLDWLGRPWRRGTLRGRRATTWHPPSFHVAGVAQTHNHTYTHTYMHTYIPTVLPSRSFTTSFLFPSFPVPAKTIETHFRKELTCGVIRSFNFYFLLFSDRGPVPGGNRSAASCLCTVLRRDYPLLDKIA